MDAIFLQGCTNILSLKYGMKYLAHKVHIKAFILYSCKVVQLHWDSD